MFLSKLSVLASSNLIVFSLVCFGGFTHSALASPMTSSTWQEEQEGEASEAKQDEDNGDEDLDKALELNITAKSLRDLDRVAELCESAIEKGLDEEGEEQAKQIWVAALLEHADQLATRIFSSGGRDRRWQKYRRDALSRLETVFEVDNEQFEAHLLSARLNALAGGDREQARTSADKAVELAGDDKEKLSKALFSRATLSEDKDSVLADLNQAIKINPDNIEAVRFRGAYYLRNDMPEEAIKDLKTFLKSEKENVAAYYVVIETLRSLGEYDEALELIDQAIEIEPENANSHVVRAQIFLDLDKPEMVVEAATKAIELDRRNFTALLLRAQANLTNDAFADSLKDVNRALEIEPQSVGGIHLRAMINAAQEQYDESISDLEILIRGIPFPQNQTYQIQLASIQNANLDPEKAIRTYSRLLRQIPSDSPLRLNVYRGRGDAYLSLAKHKEAIEDYNKALELDEDDDHTLNNLAWVLSTSNTEELRDGKRAIELATKACEVTDYKEAHILSTLAAGYAEAGEFDNAIKFLKQGLEISAREEQQESMRNELSFYEKKEPFREVQDIEEERAKRDKERAEKSNESEKSKDDKDSDGEDKKTADGDKEKSGDGGDGGGIA